MIIAPGQRADLLVKTAVLPPDVQKTYYLMRLGYDGAVGGNGDPTAEIVVAKMVVRGKPMNMALPNPADLAKCVRCSGCRCLNSFADHSERHAGLRRRRSAESSRPYRCPVHDQRADVHPTANRFD